jgi:hypothetical protein
MSITVNTNMHLGGSDVSSQTDVRFFDERDDGHDFTSITIHMRVPHTHISHELCFYDMTEDVATEIGTALIQYAGGVREREEKKRQLSLLTGGESEVA